MANDDAQLQQERGMNQQYMRLLQRNDDGGRGFLREVTPLPANSQFHGLVAGGKGRLAIEPFIGRVVLSEDDEILGRSFYIGSGRLSEDGIEVIKWVTPMAELFYTGRMSGVDIADLLIGRRTFSKLGDDIAAFEDTLEAGQGTNPFTALNTETDVVVEPAPRPVQRPTVQRTTTKIGPRTPATPSVPTPSTPADEAAKIAAIAAPSVSRSLLSAASGSPTNIKPSEQIEGLRAPKTVLEALNAPRTGHLSSLLRTLQPQQYDLVTWPEEDHLIVQGHPGTGKTVIGLHRAAFLTDPARIPDGRRPPRGKVLIIGPTAAYVDHVRPVLADLAPEDCDVMSLPAFYSEFGGFANKNLPTDQDRVSTSATALGATVLRVLGSYTGPKTIKAFAKHLLSGADEVLDAAQGDTDVVQFLATGKSYEHATTHSRFHPMLALAGLALRLDEVADNYRHVIVDEAQDLTPIDNQMLRMLTSQGLTLTLVGDMNQRRSHYTHHSWDEVAEAVNILGADGAPPVETIEVGYRSTNQILRFASGLLPKAERGVQALRNGPTPTIVKCTTTDLVAAAVREAESLIERVGGLVAIITLDHKSVEDHLRRKAWRSNNAVVRHSWVKNQESPPILVLTPDTARGLEFDGVVVLEPHDFTDQLVKRQGVLYTSLTRATKELSVVHARALPKELKAR